MNEYKFDWDYELVKRRVDVFVVQSIIKQAALALFMSGAAFLLGAVVMYIIWITSIVASASAWCIVGTWTIYVMGIVTAFIGIGFIRGFGAFIGKRVKTLTVE